MGDSRVSHRVLGNFGVPKARARSSRPPRPPHRRRQLLKLGRCLRNSRICTHIHTYIHTYICTYIIHTYLPTYIHTYGHNYIYTHTHTHIHAYVGTYAHIQWLHMHALTVNYSALHYYLPLHSIPLRPSHCIYFTLYAQI